MLPLDEVRSHVAAAVPGAQLTVVPNDTPANQPSLLVDSAHAVAVARFLRDTPELRLDFCSNVTGIDWPEQVVKAKIKKRVSVDGVEKEVEEIVETLRSGYLEVIYHLYSMEKKHGPVILRLRTENRTDR